MRSHKTKIIGLKILARKRLFQKAFAFLLKVCEVPVLFEIPEII